MKYYDARIIENCCVFSYEVQTPDHSPKKGDKRKKSSGITWKKALIRFLLFLLLPFAWIIDSVVMIAKDADKDSILAVVKADEKVAAAIDGKTIVKEIVVPGKIINIVVK